MLLRPGKMNLWRWTRVIAAYLIAVAAIQVQAFTQILFSVEGGSPLYLNSLQAGPLYSIFGIALIVLTVLCVINLARSAYVAPNEIIRRQLRTLVAATLITGLIAPVSLVSSGLDLFPMPMVVMSGVLTVFVVMVGYGIARYSALVHKRTIDRDFFFNLLGILTITGVYTAASWVLVFAYDAPRVIVIFIPLLGVLTHTALNAGSIFLDWLFYRGETRRLRNNLHDLRRLAGETDAMTKMLEEILATLCNPIRASYGLILIHKNGTARQVAHYHWKWGTLELPSDLLTADDFRHLTPGELAAPLEDAALLVPLYNESAQVGALLLGRPTNGMQYAHADVERLLYPADQIADALFQHRRNSEQLEKVASIATQSAQVTDKSRIPVDTIDLVLKNLFDYTYLSDSRLAEMDIVRVQMTGDRKTHIDRGKVVQAVVVEALEKMRPGPVLPKEPIPREWFPYVILHDAYVEGVQNRDIMGKLYISEGTFNRTRRSAIRSLARALVEMEHSR
jgi:hypothetical protein